MNECPPLPCNLHDCTPLELAAGLRHGGRNRPASIVVALALRELGEPDDPHRQWDDAEDLGARIGISESEVSAAMHHLVRLGLISHRNWMPRRISPARGGGPPLPAAATATTSQERTCSAMSPGGAVLP